MKVAHHHYNLELLLLKYQLSEKGSSCVLCTLYSHNPLLV